MKAIDCYFSKLFLFYIFSILWESQWHFVLQQSTCLQLRDCELAPGVNRDLVRRVRNVNGITQHKQVLRNDIKLAAKLIHTLDEKGELWSRKFQEEGPSVEVQQPSTFTSAHLECVLMVSDVSQTPAQNPILKNITDYLIEEVSAEEEELLGSGSGMEPEETAKEGHAVETTVEREEKLAKVCRLHRHLFNQRVSSSMCLRSNLTTWNEHSHQSKPSPSSPPRCWIVSSCICASCIPSTTTTPANTRARMKCPIVAEWSTCADPSLQTASHMGKVSVECQRVCVFFIKKFFWFFYIADWYFCSATVAESDGGEAEPSV